MIRVYLMSFLFIIALAPSFAGGENRPVGSRSASMSNSSVCLSDLWSAFNNQAGLAHITQAQAGFYYENRYLLKELGYKAAAFACPFEAGALGLSFTHFGFSAYNESKIGLAYAKKMGKYLSLGVQLDYCMIHLDENYGNHSFVTFEAGALSNISPKLTLGVHIYNPVHAKISGNTDERAPAIFRMGAAYSVTKKFMITAETEKNIDHKAVLRSGFEYQLTPVVNLRAGIATNPATVSFGVGVCTGNLVMDFSASYHQVLGFSPQASLTYKF